MPLADPALAPAPASASASASAASRAFAATAAAVLATYNNVVGRHAWHDRWYVPLNASATGAALAAAVAGGLTSA